MRTNLDSRTIKIVSERRETRAGYLRRRTKEWLESGKDLAPDVVQGEDGQVDSRFLTPRPSILERYKASGLSVNLNVVLRPIVGEPECGGFCAILHYSTSNPDRRDWRQVGRNPRAGRDDAALREIQRSVLVRVVEFVEEPERT